MTINELTGGSRNAYDMSNAGGSRAGRACRDNHPHGHTPMTVGTGKLSF